MNEVEGYLRDLGKTIPSFDGEWDKEKEYERLAIVYTRDGNEPSDDDGDGGGTPGIEQILVSITNNQGALIRINGAAVSSKNVDKGSNVVITLEKQGYRTKTTTVPNIQTPYIETIDFTDADRLQFTVNVYSNVPNTTIVINGVETNVATVYYGDNVTIIGTPIGYNSKQEIINNITENKIVTLQFTDADKITTKYIVSVNVNLPYDSCKINGVETSTAEIYEGQNANIVVKKTGYYDKTRTITNVQSNQTVDIEFTNDDKIKFIIVINGNMQNATYHVYDENDNEIQLDNNNSFVADYGSYAKIVASVPDYNDKEIVYPSITEQVNPYFEFTDADLAPVFRISKDGVNWEIFLYDTPQIGVWITLYFKTVNNAGIKMRVNATNGITSWGGNVNYDSHFDIVDGEQVYKIRINSMDIGASIAFEFNENIEGNVGSLEYVGYYMTNN